MIKAIIFDWAGVIGADGYWVWLAKNVPNLEKERPYFQKISEQVDGGEISNEEFVKLIGAKVNQPTEEIWRGVKAEIIINHELIDYIRQLKTEYKIGLLSNFTYPWLHEIISDNELWELFDHHIISSEHKMIKPNPKIFHKMLAMLGIDASEAIFIDDRQYNVDASNALGIRSFLYTNVSALRDDLAHSGVTSD
jgi:HAD superfamily hydrolase (TIGR01509 family)